jgi:hypothetical protein
MCLGGMVRVPVANSRTADDPIGPGPILMCLFAQ